MPMQLPCCQRRAQAGEEDLLLLGQLLAQHPEVSTALHGL